jgi:Fic family protein
MFLEYEAAVPPNIAARMPHLGPAAVNALADATSAIATLDSQAVLNMRPLWTQLLRSESVASSKIERIYTKQAELAAALAGSRATKAARDVAAHVAAIEQLVQSAAEKWLDLNALAEAHRALLGADPVEGPFAGRFRDVQNWIGGSDETPRAADFVPPAPSRVEPLMRDLMHFTAREDMPALVQAAVAHAQFETIHPFTDGNGRLGRALVHAVLRRRGLTKRTMVPIAAALLADPASYFDALMAYRLEGDVDRLVELFASCAAIAARESLVAMRELIALPTRWRSEMAPRSGSVVDLLLGLLVEQPVITLADIVAISGTTPRGAYDAIAKLEEHAVLCEMTKRKRDRVWCVPDVFGVVEDLERRIGRRKKPRSR